MRYQLLRTDKEPFISPLTSPFKCLVIIERKVSNDVRNQICETLASAGCLWLHAHGNEATIWDDVMAMTNIEEFGFDKEIPPEKFIMTTWSTNQTLAEAFWELKYMETHGCVKLEKLLVLDLNEKYRRLEMMALYKNA